MNLGKPKRPDLWITLSVHFYEDPKIAELSDAAKHLYIAGLLLAKRNNTDGQVTLAQMRTCRSGDIEPLVKELVEQDLWIPVDDRTFQARSWLNWNPSRAEVEAYRQQQVEFGKKGGRPRTGPLHVIEGGPVKKERRASGYPDDFEEFWTTYPRRANKKDAAKAFLRAVRSGVSAETLTEAAKRYADDENLPDPQFVPYPATWINQGGYENGPLPTRSQSSSASRFDEFGNAVG